MLRNHIAFEDDNKSSVPLSARYLSDLSRSLISEKHKLSGRKSELVTQPDCMESSNIGPSSTSNNFEETSTKQLSKPPGAKPTSIVKENNFFLDAASQAQEVKTAVNLRYENSRSTAERGKKGVVILERRKQLSETNCTSPNSSSLSNNNLSSNNNVNNNNSNSQNLINYSTRNPSNTNNNTSYNNKTSPNHLSAYYNSPSISNQKAAGPVQVSHRRPLTQTGPQILNLSNEHNSILKNLSPHVEDWEACKINNNTSRLTPSERDRLRQAKSISIMNPEAPARSALYCRTLTVGDKYELSNLSSNSNSSQTVHVEQQQQPYTNILAKSSNLLQGIKKHALEAAKQRVELLTANENPRSAMQTNLEKFIKGRIKVDNQGGAESSKSGGGSQLELSSFTHYNSKAENNSKRENPFKKYYKDLEQKGYLESDLQENSNNGRLSKPTFGEGNNRTFGEGTKIVAADCSRKSVGEDTMIKSQDQLERENEQLRSMLKKSQEEANRTLEERNAFETELIKAKKIIQKLEVENNRLSVGSSPNKKEFTLCKQRSQSTNLRERSLSQRHGSSSDEAWQAQILSVLEANNKKEALHQLEFLVRDYRHCVKFLKSLEELMKIYSADGAELNKENIYDGNCGQATKNNNNNAKSFKKLTIMSKSMEIMALPFTNGRLKANNIHETKSTKHSDQQKLISPSTPVEGFPTSDKTCSNFNGSKAKLKEIWKWVKCLVRESLKYADDHKKNEEGLETNQKIRQLTRENEAMSTIIKKIKMITGVDWMKNCDERKLNSYL